MNSWGWVRCGVLWGLFFLIAAGLGYPILNRYDPTVTDGTSDTKHYANVIAGKATHQGKSEFRVLQPMVGQIAYALYPAQLDIWNRRSVGLLFSSSVFVASSTTLLFLMASSTLGARSGLLASFLYLSNFWISNSALCGMVDAAEGFFLLLTAWVCLQRRWWLLPVLGILGALTKETFVVLGTVLCGCFLLMNRWDDRRQRWTAWCCGAAMAVLGVLTFCGLRWWFVGSLTDPLSHAMTMKSRDPIGVVLRQMVLDPGFYYGWIWLVPLALVGRRMLPLRWFVAASGAGVAALALAVFHNSGGANIARPLFSLLGPCLCIAAAHGVERVANGGAIRPAES